MEHGILEVVSAALRELRAADHRSNSSVLEMQFIVGIKGVYITLIQSKFSCLIDSPPMSIYIAEELDGRTLHLPQLVNLHRVLQGTQAR